MIAYSIKANFSLRPMQLALETLVVREKGEKHVLKPSGHPTENKFFQ